MDRIKALQGVRGIAISLIMISHCDILYNSLGASCTMWLGGLE
jgi:peptidoglycan/LPS O-acetylase OafA/YrhL